MPSAIFSADGLLLNINTTDLTDVKLSFDYRAFHTGYTDEVVAGYFVGDLNFVGTTCIGEGEAGCFRDFFNDDLGGSQSAAENWWNTQWTEIVRESSLWKSISDYELPEDTESIWVSFWLDDGEKDFGKIDNIHVSATVLPEPISSILFIIGGATLGLRRFWKKRKT